MDDAQRQDRWRKLFDERGIPQPDGELANVRWIMGRDDWYVLLSDGKWYWYDQREKAWKWTMYGPG